MAFLVADCGIYFAPYNLYPRFTINGILRPETLILHL